MLKTRTAIAAWTLAGVWAAFALPVQAEDANAFKRGEYVFNLAGCEGCHTDKKNGGERLSGGRAFPTDFGTFYSPNITLDPDTGIGAWTLNDFTNALRHGQAPDGSNYFPSFPYTAYTHMTDPDLADLWTYLQAQPVVSRPNQAHQLRAPFGWRWLMTFWNGLYLDTGPKPDWPRGRYVAEALSHCHECHTPRNALGGRLDSMAYAGTARNPEGITVPNITPDPQTGIGTWATRELSMLLGTGMLPDGDFVGGVMAESVTHATSKMTEDDRQALIDYLGTLAPIINRVKTEKPRKTNTQDW